MLSRADDRRPTRVEAPGALSYWNRRPAREPDRQRRHADEAEMQLALQLAACSCQLWCCGVRRRRSGLNQTSCQLGAGADRQVPPVAEQHGQADDRPDAEYVSRPLRAQLRPPPSAERQAGVQRQVAGLPVAHGDRAHVISQRRAGGASRSGRRAARAASGGSVSGSMPTCPTTRRDRRRDPASGPTDHVGAGACGGRASRSAGQRRRRGRGAGGESSARAGALGGAGSTCGSAGAASAGHERTAPSRHVSVRIDQVTSTGRC